MNRTNSQIASIIESISIASETRHLEGSSESRQDRSRSRYIVIVSSKQESWIRHAQESRVDLKRTSKEIKKIDKKKK